jgi:hypothetical protein
MQIPLRRKLTYNLGFKAERKTAINFPYTFTAQTDVVIAVKIRHK